MQGKKFGDDKGNNCIKYVIGGSNVGALQTGGERGKASRKTIRACFWEANKTRGKKVKNLLLMAGRKLES